MNDTIAAIATPIGRGGVGIVRISGVLCKKICKELSAIDPIPRHAHYTSFMQQDGVRIDEGLLLFFAGPNSFTGEDVLELHGHGGNIVLDMLLRRVLELGARMARAGEFSERAFVNNKMDLVQAEAVAQLINANTEQAAAAAIRSLQGDFSKTIDQMVKSLIDLRMFVEAAIDFPDEEIDFISDNKVVDKLNKIEQQLQVIHKQAAQGVLLAEGVDVVIAGKPNAGKSTLLNSLTGQDTAIVTPIAGTTRDAIKAQINLDGLLLNVTDTAGLRATDDVVEIAGIERSWKAIANASVVMLVVDSTQDQNIDPVQQYPALLNKKTIVVYNKIDQSNVMPKVNRRGNFTEIYLSASSGAGLELLRSTLRTELNLTSDGGAFMARRRHLDALRLAQQQVNTGLKVLLSCAAGELLAEHLRMAQQHLEEITGRFTSDDLLGKIFSEFCIGK